MSVNRATLRELHIGLLGGEPLHRALATACEVEALGSVGWRERLAERPVDLLLVEGAERPSPEWREGLPDLLEECLRRGIPRMLWITAGTPDPAWLELADRFDRGFAVSVGALLALGRAGAPDPSLLWPATALPVDERPVPETGARPDPVVWICERREDWPDELRERLVEVLRVAEERGARVADTSSPGYSGALERARLVLVVEPPGGGVPAAVFDAIACGTAVVSTVPIGSVWEFCTGGSLGVQPRALISAVDGVVAAATEIDRLLGDDELREEIVHRCRRIVAYNHTYSHRAATLASAAGLHLIPDAPPYPAHR